MSKKAKTEVDEKSAVIITDAVLAENQAKVTALEDDITELNIKLSTPISDEYIERVAREQLGYRMPGEIIFYNDIAE